MDLKMSKTPEEPLWKQDHIDLFDTIPAILSWDIS